MGAQKWIKLGITGGFLFFFLKGLAWIGVLVAAAIGFF